MRVIYIIHSTNPFDGSTKSLLTLLKGVIRLGVAPMVVVPDKNGLTQILQQEGIPTIILHKYNMDIYPLHNNLYQYGMFLPILLIRRIRHYIAYFQLKAICKRLHPDIIHSNTSVISFGYEVAQTLHIPHIYHIREYANLIDMKYFPSQKRFKDSLLTEQSYSICITHGVQAHYQLTNRSNSFVIYNGISTPTNPTTLSEPQKFFLYAGRIEPLKGVLEMVHAYLIYRRTSMHPYPLFIVGALRQSDYVNQITQLISQEQATDDIKWIGEQSNIIQYMQAAKAIIICSPHEGFGRCMPEAMLHDCIAVAINTGGTKEQLDNGLQLTGKEIAYRYNQENELVARLLQVETAEDAELNDMRQRAKQTVSQLYNPQQYVQNIWTIYQQIVKL